MTTPDQPSTPAASVEWRVATTPGGTAHRVGLTPDRFLQERTTDAGREWISLDEHGCFRLDGLPLPAGWYRLEGRLTSSNGSPLLPSLHPEYRGGAEGDAGIPLPSPRDGRMRALVLLRCGASALRFRPGVEDGAFRVDGFAFRRVPRWRALADMLANVPGESAFPVRILRRAARYAFRAAREGIPGATDFAFADYRRRLLPARDDSYLAWVRQFDMLTASRMEALRERVAEIGSAGPLISVLLPVYQTPIPWLRRCIDSVLSQVYPHWQLCIADDASPDARVMEVLETYAAGDSRISVVRRDRNGHISAASNSALELARGAFVALLDHDDELRPHALLEVAEALHRDPDIGLVYSDEDKIDAEGNRFDPYFKPDWDPDLLRSQNYVCHLTVIRTALVRSVGGFRTGFEGSQDHDLILRCSERLEPRQIHHIPKILYHWRAIPGSTALARDAKDYASAAGARAVREHLQRRHPGAAAEELAHGHYRVRWPLPQSAPKVSLVIPTRDRADLLRLCVDSIFERTTYPDFEVVVVDNGSSEPDAVSFLAELAARPRLKVLRYDAPFNYSAINNWAVERCDGPVIALLNNDIEVISADWLEEMVAYALRPDVGAVGAMLYYPDDTIQHAGVFLGVDGVAAHVYSGLPRGYPGHGGRARVAQSLSAVTAACLVLRREVFERIGGFDPALAVAFNDIDLCLRARDAGYRNIWTPFAELYHHESASRGAEDTPEKRQRFAREIAVMEQRWGAALLDDPAYNPNLSLHDRHCALAFPPRQRSGTAHGREPESAVR